MTINTKIANDQEEKKTMQKIAKKMRIQSTLKPFNVNKKFMLSRVRLCTILLLVCLHIKGQDFGIMRYTIEDGLPSMKIYEIIQDNTGLLWMGSENGLISFDGTEFKTYTHADLLDNDIISICLGSDDGLYFFNLSQQFGYVRNGEIGLLDHPILNKTKKDIVLNTGKNYLIMRSMLKGIWKHRIIEFNVLDNDSIEIIPTRRCILDAETDKEYVYNDDFFYYSEVDSQTIYYHGDKLVRNLESDNKYFAFKSKHTNAELYEVDSLLWSYIYEDRESRLVKYEDGFFTIMEGKVTYYDPSRKQFFPIIDETKVNTVFMDMEENLWVSTAANGLIKITSPKSKFGLFEHQLDEGIKSIQEGDDGTIHLGSTTGTLFIDPFNDIETIEITEIPRPLNIYPHDSVYYLYTEYNVVVFDPETRSTSPLKFHPSGYKSIAIKDSLLYMGSSIYLSRMNVHQKDVKILDEKAERILPDTRINELFKDKNGKIYVASIKGLGYEQGDSVVFDEDAAYNSANVSCIRQDKDESLWIGTRKEGIYNIKNDSVIHHINELNGLLSNNVNSLELTENEILVSTNGGLTILDRSTYECKTLSTSNILRSNNVLTSKLIKGKYWIGTNKDLVVLDPKLLKDLKQAKPKLTVKNLLVNGVEVDYTPNMKLDNDQNNIQINLQNISFKSGQDKTIRYRISSSDSEWITTNDDFVRFSSLTPGQYSIEAVGISSIGSQSDIQDIIFKINPPWWETFPGIVMITFGLISLGYIVLRIRIRRERMKREYTDQINRIKDQALQLQMNPHFIFNSLNAIQGFIGTENEELAMNYLARFARLIRLIFEHSKGSTITLEEELEFMTLYLDLEKLRFKNKVDIQINIEEEVDINKDFINVPPLLIQPIVENSFKHGLFHKKDKGHLTIDYSMEGDKLKIVVKDDGIGRSKADKIGRLNSEKQISSGIKTTQERIDLLNYNNRLPKNSITIEDLYDTNQEPLGTKTTLILKI